MIIAMAVNVREVLMEDWVVQDAERRGGENWSTGICQWNYPLDADWLGRQFRGKVVNNIILRILSGCQWWLLISGAKMFGVKKIGGESTFIL